MSFHFKVHSLVTLRVGTELIVHTGKDGIQEHTRESGDSQTAQGGEAQGDGVVGAVLDADGENQVDFTHSRNLFIAALILVLAIGIKYGANDAISLGFTSLSGLAVAALVGILLNAILPGNDYVFDEDSKGSSSVSFGPRRVGEKPAPDQKK